VEATVEMEPEQIFNKGKDNISHAGVIKTVCIPANSSAMVFVQTSCVQGTVFLESLDSLDPTLQVVEAQLVGKSLNTPIVVKEFQVRK